MTMNRQIMLTSILALGIAAPAWAASEVDPAGAITDQHLAIFDLDADGAVSRSEYRVTTSNVFILMDADSDNMLSPAEAEGIPEALFDGMDTDGDGMASRAEYDTQILADFDAADLDGNGLLN
jgi:hypothetical protein